MKNLWQILKQSLTLPQKKAVFGLNQVRMDFTLFYLFILIAIASLPALILQITTDTTSGLYVHIFFKLIYFFAFYYLILVGIVFGIISMIALIGLLISRVLKRKLHYSTFWKMSAFTSTIPLLLFTLFSFFYELTYLFLFIMILFEIVIIVRIILIYPKRKVS